MGDLLGADVVREAWYDCFPADVERAAERFAEVARRYGEPHRHYHTISHIRDVTLLVWKLSAPPPPELILATVLHDIIYDPRANDNEERSADYARELLQGLGVGTDLREEVARLILLTKAHQAPAGDRHGEILLDADLSILSEEPARYDEYTAAIRREYAWVPEAEYRVGRRGVLNRFLARPAIYHTPVMRPREPLARANLAREIASLS
jgi:predicted metal-dependent HD superfamily phosphohydrolase